MITMIKCGIIKKFFSISPSDLYTHDYTYEFIEDLGCKELIQILSDLGKDIFVKEWSTRGYCQGDYIKGIAFCTKERYIKMVSNNTSDWKTQIDKLIDDEVKSIGMWMWGDVKGYVLEKKVKFVKKYKDESEEDKKESTDGLYIIYKDGHAEPFTGDNSKDCVRYIGLKHRYMSFAISLTEHDIIQLLDDDSREESGSGTYYERKCDALFDIDGRGNTERLVTRNPKLRNLLEDGEYIPSLGQLNLMAHYMDELNKAFAYVSASPLSSTWYRSSTESSPSVAWYVDFSIGSAYYSDKYNSSRVRAVIDF